DIHVYSGICLPIPVLLGVVSKRRGKLLRSDLKFINAWNKEDRLWFRTWGRDPLLRPGKFNAGQKANTAFIGGAIIVMLGTGLIMKWFGPFPLSWRTGATFVHDVVALAIAIIVLGHIVYALRYPATLKAMFTGYVSEDWAAEHAPAWQQGGVEA
ncbi:MAG TPA: cytochrome b/b6 domain-containing protein, partial [Acidimicrobiales bacterium]|nr:cytochrome b/b6 domain-containing protein [Acidimicrobiales bacterium]